MDEEVDAALDRPRTSAEALAVFALTAMGLAAVGMYSLITQFVHSRRQEIGVRMALGASPRRIVTTLLASAGRLIASGVAIGLILTYAGQRLIQSMLFGVGSLDLLSISAAVFLLVAVSAAAALIPARRAAAIDPVESMRVE
jgi:ABC-type antimicrobial peptide transport system permease subunit